MTEERENTIQGKFLAGHNESMIGWVRAAIYELYEEFPGKINEGQVVITVEFYPEGEAEDEE